MDRDPNKSPTNEANASSPHNIMKDVATETSHADVMKSTTTFSTASFDSRQTLTDIRSFSKTEYRNAATETDFPVVTSLTISITTTDIDDDYSSGTIEEEMPTRRDPLPKFAASIPSSSEDAPKNTQRREFTLKSSKSQHVRKLRSSRDGNKTDFKFNATATSSSAESLKDTQRPEFALKSSKSQHVRKQQSSSDEDKPDSNLNKGNVFVYMIIPPDGGYGWFIMIISFLCQVVVDGIIFAIGILLPHIAKEFNVPGSKVILVASMQVGFYFLSGAISSAFINKYGFRPVALAGCLLSITVLTIATFSTNLLMLIIFYSMLGGPGLSMIWVSSQLIIGYYFEKYRPIANGLSCSGAGVGIMMFSYMNNILVARLGWRNLMRVHVGFLVLVLLMGLTFVEVAPTRIGRVKEMTWEDTESDSWDVITDLTLYSRYSLKTVNQVYTLDEDFQTVLEKMPESHRQSTKGGCCPQLANSCCPCFNRCLAQSQESAATTHYVIRQDLMEKPDLFYTGPSERPPDTTGTDRRKTVAFSEGEMRAISLDHLDRKIDSRRVVNTLSTMNVNRQLLDHRKSYRELKETKRCPLLAYLRPVNLIHPKIRHGFNLLFDFRLMAIREFRVLLASAFLFPMGFNIPFVYSTVRVQIEPSFAKLISPSIGFSNFAFRIASGFVAYKFREQTTYICGGGMVFGGVAVFLSAFYGLDVVWFQFLYAICYGIAPAFYSTLRAIIYVRSLGLDKLTNAFGLTALAMGMGVFIGTTAAGILNDLTGDYTASFAFAGICIIVAGALKLLLPYLTA